MENEKVKKLNRIFEFPKTSGVRNTAIYARVSTSSSAQLRSLGKQLQGLTDFIASHVNLRLYDVYIDVDSGRRNSERKGMERLLDDCRAGKVDFIITKSVSRFYRDTVNLLVIVRELAEIGVEIYFQNDNILSTTDESEFIITLIGAIAQAESDEKSKNIKWGIDKAMKNPDSKMNSKLIYGYNRDSNDELVVNPDRAKVVTMIFALYMDGKGLQAIIQELSQKGIQSPRGKEEWSKRSIEKIISDERYTGMIKTSTGLNYNKLEKIKYPVIIPRSLFEEVQREIAKRKHTKAE